MEEEKKQIQIVNNFIMYCRGFEDKKFSEKELFNAIEFLDELVNKQQKELEELKSENETLKNAMADLFDVDRL